MWELMRIGLEMQERMIEVQADMVRRWMGLWGGRS